MSIFKKVYKKVVKPAAESFGREAESTYNRTAGRLLRRPGVSPRKAYQTAKRIVTAPKRIAQELKREPKKRPRRR